MRVKSAHSLIHTAGAALRRFMITESEADLTSHAGLGLIGMALNQCTDLADDAAAVSSLRSDAMVHATILSSDVALLCLGKSDFETITGFREDPYFREASGLDSVPSEGILRQRMDAHAAAYQGVVEAPASAFLRRSGARITPLDTSLVALDCAVTPFDNSQSEDAGGLAHRQERGRLSANGGLSGPGRTAWSRSCVRAASTVGKARLSFSGVSSGAPGS
jgi:hypothetical protein